jgi:hypothetical protein
MVVHGMYKALERWVMAGPKSLKNILEKVYRGLVRHKDDKCCHQEHYPGLLFITFDDEVEKDQEQWKPRQFATYEEHDVVKERTVPSVDGKEYLTVDI